MNPWAIAIAIVLVTVGAITATSFAGPAMAAISFDDGRLVVRPLGLMRLWALRGQVVVEPTQVIDVGVARRRELRLGLRLPGTYLPGVLTAGTFRSRGERSLWLVGRSGEVLVLELLGHRYARLVVQVADPHATRAAVLGALDR